MGVKQVEPGLSSFFIKFFKVVLSKPKTQISSTRSNASDWLVLFLEMGNVLEITLLIMSAKVNSIIN